MHLSASAACKERFTVDGGGEESSEILVPCRPTAKEALVTEGSMPPAERDLRRAIVRASRNICART